MIIIFTGGIGSGKTLSAVRLIIESDTFAYTNFSMKGYKDHYRLKMSDIILNIKDEKGKIVSKTVNWGFWNKARKEHQKFSVVFDEAHNFFSSRASMSKTSQLFSNFQAQIRKLLNDSVDNHLILITQKLRRIDVNARELAHYIIECESAHIGKKTYIKQKIYSGIDNYENGFKSGRLVFSADKYFNYYDTRDIVTIEDIEDESYV